MTQQPTQFDGLRVAAFESRRADDTKRLLEREGAVAHVSPSMREVPLEDDHDAVEFARKLVAGDFDAVIFLTGVGVRHLVKAVEGQVDRDEFTRALSDATTIARGPKPVSALRELGVRPTYTVGEPNTWRDLLALVDAKMSPAGKRVAVQEYGLPNPHLTSGLEARGAEVTCVRVYAWDLPEDTGPLEANVRRICDGEIDVALFTSSYQIINLLQVAGRLQLEQDLRRGLRRVVVGSIGPTTSETLREQGLPIDFEPQHPKLGHLISTAAKRGRELSERKQRVSEVFTDEVPQPPPQPPATENSLFLRACRREPTERTPIWLMRQAGRYMEEYRRVREKVSFLELCRNPQLCAEVMLTAVDKIGVDAAIIFADLLPILVPMGLDLEFQRGEGPVIHNPVRETEDLQRVRELESVDSLDFVMETVRLTRAGLPDEIPVIGFAGAPFTLASYTIEGGGSRSYVHTKTLMYRDEGAWHELMGRLARSITRYLNAQIAAGAQAVQIFDSWVGCLGVEDYRRYVLPHSQTVIQNLVPGVPVIHFGTGNPALLPLFAEAGGDVIGVDWRIPLDDAWAAVGYDKAVQGNLEPLVLLATPDEIRRRAKDVLDRAAGRPGHIFNLGHGIIPQVPVDHVIHLVEAVKELSAR